MVVCRLLVISCWTVLWVEKTIGSCGICYPVCVPCHCSQPEGPGRFLAFDHLCFWVGNAKQVWLAELWWIHLWHSSQFLLYNVHMGIKNINFKVYFLGARNSHNSVGIIYGHTVQSISVPLEHCVFHDRAFSINYWQELPVGGASCKLHGPEYAESKSFMDTLRESQNTVP